MAKEKMNGKCKWVSHLSAQSGNPTRCGAETNEA